MIFISHILYILHNTFFFFQNSFKNTINMKFRYWKIAILLIYLKAYSNALAQLANSSEINSSR